MTGFPGWAVLCPGPCPCSTPTSMAVCGGLCFLTSDGDMEAPRPESWAQNLAQGRDSSNPGFPTSSCSPGWAPLDGSGRSLRWSHLEEPGLLVLSQDLHALRSLLPALCGLVLPQQGLPAMSGPCRHRGTGLSQGKASHHSSALPASHRPPLISGKVRDVTFSVSSLGCCRAHVPNLVCPLQRRERRGPSCLSQLLAASLQHRPPSPRGLSSVPAFPQCVSLRRPLTTGCRAPSDSGRSHLKTIDLITSANTVSK